jgi:hypothetical protein
MFPRIRIGLLPALLTASSLALAAPPPKKPHVVVLGAQKQVPYSKAGDPAGAGPDETSLKIRALLVDGRISEWTTGDPHDVTDRSFAVRRALRINDSLPGDSLPGDSVPGRKAGEKPASGQQTVHWVWQRGPWLLVDRASGHVTALKLPDYDPAASQVAWFRDYAAYCGVTPAGKSLYAVVAQIGARKPVLAKKLSAYDLAEHPWPVCGLPEWQRQPLKVTFHPAGRDPASFDLVGGSAVLVEDDDDPEKP